MSKKPPVRIGKFKEPKWERKVPTGNNAKGDSAGKGAKHTWLRKNYGRPAYCMNSLCDKLSNWYDWALKTGKTYSHDPSDYLWLCRRCHRLYDLTDVLKEKALKNLTWNTIYKDPFFCKCGERGCAQGLCKFHYNKAYQAHLYGHYPSLPEAIKGVLQALDQ